MSIAGMRSEWRILQEGLEGIRPSISEALAAGQPIAGFSDDQLRSLDQILEASESLRRQGDLAIRDEEPYQVVSVLLLAAAAVDVMVASDLAEVDSEFNPGQGAAFLREYGRDPTEFEPVTGELAEGIIREGDGLISEVADLFETLAPPIFGSSPFPDRAALRHGVQNGVTQMVDAGVPPATGLAKGMFTLSFGGLGEFISATMHADVAAELARSAHHLGKHSPRFLREHVAKMATLRSDQRTVDRVTDRVKEATEEAVEHFGLIESLLGFVAGPEDCIAYSERKIASAFVIENQHADALVHGLASLQANWNRQMHWIAISARWLRRGIRFLAHLAAAAIGPLSYVFGAGIFLVGLGYVCYALADHLDARNLGLADRVPGVVRIVDMQILG